MNEEEILLDLICESEARVALARDVLNEYEAELKILKEKLDALGL